MFLYKCHPWNMFCKGSHALGKCSWLEAIRKDWTQILVGVASSYRMIIHIDLLSHLFSLDSDLQPVGPIGRNTYSTVVFVVQVLVMLLPLNQWRRKMIFFIGVRAPGRPTCARVISVASRNTRTSRRTRGSYATVNSQPYT